MTQSPGFDTAACAAWRRRLQPTIRLIEGDIWPRVSRTNPPKLLVYNGQFRAGEGRVQSEKIFFYATLGSFTNPCPSFQY